MILSLQCLNDLRQPVSLLLPRIALSSEKSLNSAFSNSEEPPFIAGFYYNWFAFTPAYLGSILTRSIFARCMDQPQKMICPGISSLELARRTQERASPIRKGTVHFAHGSCFDDRFCSRPMWEVRISSKHWRQWWNVINDDQQRIMLRILCMLCHCILFGFRLNRRKSAKEWPRKRSGNSSLTNGSLHFPICVLRPGKAWERKTWPQHVGVYSKTSNTKPLKMKAASIAQMIFLHPGEWPWAQWNFAVLQKSCGWIGSRICIIWYDMMQYCSMQNTYDTS